MLDFNNLL